MPSHPAPGVTPHQRARIRELRAIPWLGLRRIARALGLSLHQVRTALLDDAEPPPTSPGAHPPRRCPTCGAMVNIEPCVACAAQGLGARG